MKCAGVGVENFSKNTHVRCGSVRSKKLLCAECAGVPKLAAHKYSAGVVLTVRIKQSSTKVWLGYESASISNSHRSVENFLYPKNTF